MLQTHEQKDSRREGYKGNILIVHNASLSDSGTYTCSFKTANNVPHSVSMNITIIGKTILETTCCWYSIPFNHTFQHFVIILHFSTHFQQHIYLYFTVLFSYCYFHVLYNIVTYLLIILYCYYIFQLYPPTPTFLCLYKILVHSCPP